MICLIHNGDSWELNEIDSFGGNELLGKRLITFEHLETAVQCWSAITIGAFLRDIGRRIEAPRKRRAT